VIVTGSNQPYFDQQRLHNLIGSIHHWEPGVRILFYDLGLSASSLDELQRWEGVEVRRLAYASLPKHVADPTQYAFKPLAILDALATHPRVLWLDANAELRRPLDDVRMHMEADGHFLTTQPYDFPTPQFHHPQCVRGLGCLAPDLTQQHCSTAFVGMLRGGWLHRHVLTPAAECALVGECINPPGSHRGNHRQEQTVVNAILCRLLDHTSRNGSASAAVEGGWPEGRPACRGEKRWRLTSDFENDGDPLQPSADETDFNDMVFYTRRDFPRKPYVRHLRLRDA
jgi:hypothetical protein